MPLTSQIVEQLGCQFPTAVDFKHVDREGILDLFALDHLAALVLLSCGRFDSYHGSFSDDIEADLDGDFFIFHARLHNDDLEDALFDIVLDKVLVSESENAMQLFIASFYLAIGRIINPQLKYLRLCIRR